MVFDRSQIKNFPNQKGLTSYKKQGKIYIVKESKIRDLKSEKLVTKRTIVGRIIDSTYYSMDEFHAKFKRDLSLREPDNALPTRKKAHTLEKSLKRHNLELKDIKNMPKMDNLSVFKQDGFLYVLIRKSYIQDGKRKEQRTYLGKIIDSKFYTMEQCKLLNNKARSKQYKNQHKGQ